MGRGVWCEWVVWVLFRSVEVVWECAVQTDRKQPKTAAKVRNFFTRVRTPAEKIFHLFPKFQIFAEPCVAYLISGDIGPNAVWRTFNKNWRRESMGNTATQETMFSDLSLPKTRKFVQAVLINVWYICLWYIGSLFLIASSPIPSSHRIRSSNLGL